MNFTEYVTLLSKCPPEVRIIPNLGKIVVTLFACQLVGTVKILSKRIPFAGQCVFIATIQVFFGPSCYLIQVFEGLGFAEILIYINKPTDNFIVAIMTRRPFS